MEGSLDQHDETLRVMNAYSSIALVICNWLLEYPIEVPNGIMLDTLVRSGSAAYKKLYTMTLKNNFLNGYLYLKTPLKKMELPLELDEIHPIFFLLQCL